MVSLSSTPTSSLGVVVTQFIKKQDAGEKTEGIPAVLLRVWCSRGVLYSVLSGTRRRCAALQRIPQRDIISTKQVHGKQRYISYTTLGAASFPVVHTSY